MTMILLLVAVVAVVRVAQSAPPDYGLERDEQWASFKYAYRKNYDSVVEENFRRSVFHENQRKIALHNDQYNLGIFSYKLKTNQFGDMLFDEYKNYMHADNQTVRLMRGIPRGEQFVPPRDNSAQPSFVDWRELGAVTSVQDQGLTCGSCWAFSATGALEGQYWRKTGVLRPLSAQSLLDCSGEYGNLGCGGGSAALSFQFVLDRKGLETEASYAYEGRAKPCPYAVPQDDDLDEDDDRPSFMFVGYGDEDALRAAVATAGPLSAAIDGSHDTFRFYSEGVYYQPECDKEDLDHAVLIVGYGTDKTTGHDYWLVKNSWGESWGEMGYFKIARNRHNHCGIAAAAIYPVI